LNSNDSYDDKGDKPQTPDKDRKLEVGKSLTSIAKDARSIMRLQ
jgi:hypothetical protein